MQTLHPIPVTELPGGHVLRVIDGAGHGVAVFQGVVWITQADDSRDVFLLPGETFHFDRDGLAVIEALSDTRLAVVPAPKRAASRALAATVLSAALAVGSSLYLVSQAGRTPATPDVVVALDGAR
jgi:hypothetical protein